MERSKYLVFFLAFYFFIGLTGVCSQNLPEKSSLLVAPFKPNTTHHYVLKGLQQIMIDELGRITGETIANRELINQFLKNQGTGKEPYTIYYTDIPDLTDHLNAKKVLLMDFNEKHGKVSVKTRFIKGRTGTTISQEQTNGILGAFPKLEKNLIDSTLGVLGFLGNEQIQKKASEGPECLLDGVAVFGKGLDYLDQGSLGNAAKYFRRAIALDPTIYSIQLQLQQVCEKAEEELIEPADIGIVYLGGGDLNKAKSFFAEALGENTSDIKALVGTAQIFFERNELGMASKNLQSVLAIDQKNLEALVLMAQVYKAQKKYPEALSVVEQAIKIDPTDTDLNKVAGELYEEAKKGDKAVHCYTLVARSFKEELDTKHCLNYLSKIRKLDPDNAIPFLIEGDLKVSLGDYREAVKIYEKGQQSDPDNDEMYQKLAFAHQQIGDTKKAENGLNKALKLNPNNVAAHVALGDLSREEKKYDEAITHYAKAKEIAPNDEETMLKLAGTYGDANKPEKAISELDEMIEHGDPGESPTKMLEAHKLMADYLTKKGDLKKAKVHLEKAIEIDPDNVSAYEALGMVEDSLGEKDNAKRALNIANLLDPTRSKAKSTKRKEKAKLPKGLKPEFLAFVQTFPSGPPKDTAPIVVNRDIAKPSFFNRVKAQLWFTREDWDAIYQDINIALSAQYKLVNPTIIETTLAKKPFNRMKVEDIDDDELMALFRASLATESTFFYRVKKIDPPEDKLNFRIYGYLFDSSKRRWEGNVALTYPEDPLTKINWPFCIVVFLLVIAGTAYGFIYFRQGFGSIQVYIERDPEASVFFSVKASQNPNVDLTKMKQSLSKGIEGRKYSRKAKFGSHSEKSMVEKDCLFEKLHVGHYFVYLYGVLLDGSGTQIGNYQLTNEVDVAAGKTTELTFDLLPKTAYVGAQIMNGEEPASGAEISIKGKSGAKYIKDEQGVFFDLEPGKYVMLIHYKNKKFSKKINITAIDEYKFTVNLGGRV